MHLFKRGLEILQSRPIEILFSLLLLFSSIALLVSPFYMFSFVPALVVIILIIFARAPQWGFYIIVALIPMNAFRALSSQYDFLTISKFLGLWIIIVLMIKYLLHKEFESGLKTNLWAWLTLFFIANVGSTILATSYQMTAIDQLRRLINIYLFFGFSLIFIDKKVFSEKLPWIIILSIGFCSMLSVFGYVFEISTFAVGLDAKHLKRATGAAADPNFFAFMVIFSLPLIMHWIFFGHKIWIRIFSGVLFLLNLFAVILTYSRSGAMVLMLIFGFMTMAYFKYFKIKYLGFILLFFTIGFISVLSLVPEAYWERQKSVVDVESERSIGRRYSYLLVARDAIKENPIVGSGPGTFRDIYAKTPYAAHYAKHMNNYRRAAHNSYLEIWVGTGIIGFAIYLIIIWISLRDFYISRKIFLKRGQIELANIVCSYLIAFIVCLIFFMFLSANYHKYFWISLALSQVSLKLAKEQ